MPKFGINSNIALETAHPDLQRLFREVIKYVDCSILEGHRDKIAQDAAYAAGKSKKRWPESKHNRQPSLAVDAAPYPVDWKDPKRFCFFAGYVKATADRLGIGIRWGGDWNSDGHISDETFPDLPHFELK